MESVLDSSSNSTSAQSQILSMAKQEGILRASFKLSDIYMQYNEALLYRTNHSISKETSKPHGIISHANHDMLPSGHGE